MKKSIQTRELISVVRGGVCLRGTYHRPWEGRSDAAPTPEAMGRVGIVFPNAGVVPRAGVADAAVYWADWLAKCGYPSFRFDLPGLGDSDRDPAAEGIDFQAHADVGGYGPWLSGIATDIVERFNVSGVVVVGHCSGAVTALYAAAANQSIKGLILLDPYFHVQYDGNVQSLLNNWSRRVSRGLGGDVAAHPMLRLVGVKLLATLRNTYHGISRTRLLVRRKKLPGSANLALIGCWNRLASAGVPMLVLRSPAYAPRAGGFDYIDYLQRRAPRGSRISLKPVEGATHAFAERKSKEPVGKYAEEWLHACFPLTKYTETEEYERHSPQLVDAMPGIERNVR